MDTKTIRAVILTRSSKHKKYCVAGLDAITGKWVRFVSNDEGSNGALSKEEIQFADGGYCKPLDVVEVAIKRSVPLRYQPENYLIDDEFFWERVGVCPLVNVLKFHPVEDWPLLYGGVLPYVEEKDMNAMNTSLTLIQVSDLCVYKNDRARTKASFSYNGQFYMDISVTDPNFYSAEGNITMNTACLVVSLPAVPFPENRYYKFIAQIFPLE